MKIKGTQLKKGRTEPVMRMYPDYQFHVSDHIIYTADRFAIATLAIEGTPFESISDSTLENDFNAIKTFLVNLGKDGSIYLWTNLVKELIQLDQEYHFDSKFLQRFSKKYISEFKGSRFFKTTYYITFGIKYKNIHDAIESMNEIIQQSLTAMGKYGAHVLSVDDDGVSDVADYLYMLLNKNHSKLPLSINPLSSSIADSEFYFGYDTLELRNNEADVKKFATNYVVKDFPPLTFSGQWDFLLGMPYEFILTQSFIYEAPTKTLKAIDAQSNKLSSVGDAAETQHQELQLGKEVVSSGVTLFGSYHCALTVFGKTAEEARANGIKLSGEFISAGKGFKFTRVNSAAPHIYFSHLPMNKERPLATRRTITNLACTFSLHNYSHGKKAGNPIGDGSALMPLKTTADGLYWFNTHYSKPGRNVRGQKIAGHALILGETGAGKTTFEGAIAAFAQRFDPYMFVVDFNRSTELFVRAYGGAYFTLREGEYTGLNPFQLIETTDDELAPRLIQFLKSWVNTLAYDQSGKPCTDEQAKELAKAVDAVMAMPRQTRRLSTLLSRVSDMNLKTRLSKWVGNGQYAWAVDSPENTFNPIGYKKVGFDTTVILEKTKEGVHPACEPLLAILFFYKTLMQRDGKFMLSIIEEFWMPANFPLTQAMIKSALKAGRMKGETMWLTSQSPEDAIECAIFAALVQQTPTKILLPNPDANWSGYEKIGLTLKEFEKLKALTLESRTMLIKQSGSSCFAKMDLYGFDDFLPIISGSMEGIMICEQIRRELNTENPDIWIPELLKRLKEL
ncbi:conjugal transfer protein [Aeromonas veronii]|uniref:VirB4 family type IV secretion/conjugal transfer ATPase n=1 Tax=Aeromonas veronii TaxID=654 RepID=UPI0009471173|nr:VirB4 family type IV secretion system protein [Aeromonas veronii]OLF56779.1 conjugal transfer protein [Aeromonas veronii]